MQNANGYYQIPRVLTLPSIHTAFHLPYPADYYFSGEMHNFWELVFISEGKAAIAKDDRIFNLGSGDLAFHPPMEFHRIWSVGEPFRLLVISFEAQGDMLERLSEGVFTLDLAQKSTLTELVEEIKEAFVMEGVSLCGREETPISAHRAVARLELFLLDILRMKSSEKKILKTRSAEDFSRVIEVMNSHLGENLSVPQLAHLSGLSVSNLKKICKKYTGEGVSKHFLRLKMIRAIGLLENGCSVSEVSEQLGFSGQSYFSFVFRRETGRTPREFKSI